MPQPFIDEEFLLESPAARHLYHEYAESQPIIDYHCHLPPGEISGDKTFSNLSEIWLGADHYKWRAMRAAGISEAIITGKDVDPFERFQAWAKTVPQTVRNPLYHWTHFELKRYFDCDLLLNEKTAEEIWALTSERLGDASMSVQSILKKFAVEVVGTTDDPCDSLDDHRSFAQTEHPTLMVPTFRPDKAIAVQDTDAWNRWTDALASAAGISVSDCVSFMDALKARHDFFHEAGCRLSDHGLESVPFAACDERTAAAIFDRLRAGESLSPTEGERWTTYLLQGVGRWNAARGWTMQIHVGAYRSANTRMLARLGADAGYDSQLDEPVVRPLAHFLDSLEQTGELPKTIFYHVNPAYLHPLATLMASFQDGRIPGKMQLGSGWWHLDNMEGMTAQIDALSSLGLLSRFVGMLTDSRSFLSFPRHEYFRRLLCNIIGQDVDAGRIPNDAELLAGLIQGICYRNAANYFGFTRT